MWQIQSALRKYPPTSPPVFMSLSGCGRAGTFAFFENAHASLHSESPRLDMVKCLEKIRDKRIHACQTLPQFSFVYTLLAEHILDNGFCKLVIEKKKNEKEDGKEEDQDPAMVSKAILRQMTIQKCP
ncbi:Protein CBG19822 [Caenorhabditis briggsae]|nr:Protein CBG19822 [Caenorhabditis briggsae]CCG58663.1 Protein CBG19822 [Caenorhabditis briggsae]